MIDTDMIKDIKFDANGLVPVVAQAHDTLAVLMLAYANYEAVRLTLETGFAHYFSRSRQKLWKKGETSGHVQYIAEVRFDCDKDALLYMVRQSGPACHTGQYSCFDTGINTGTREQAYQSAAAPLFTVQETVRDRRVNPKENSYTNYLFEKGLDKILKKVGEETAEVIIAAKNQSIDEVRYETADLLYHLTVLLTEMDMSWVEVFEELKKRHQ